MNTFIQYAIDALSLASLYGVLALGLAMTFGVARIINLAQSELIMICAYMIFATSSWPGPLIVLVAVVATVALAIGMERLVFRPLRAAEETTLLVASFGLSLLLQNVMTAIAGTKAKGSSFGSSLLGSVQIGSVSVTKLVLIEIVVTVVLLVALLLFLRKTSTGVQLRAAASDFRMAQLLGVRSQRVIILAFAISGLTAAVAGVVLTAQNGLMTPTVGVEPILLGLIAAVLGGLGSLGGAVLGGAVLGVVSVVLQVELPASIAPYRDAIVFLFVFIVLMVRPGGLFVRAGAMERI